MTDEEILDELRQPVNGGRGTVHAPRAFDATREFNRK